MRTPTLSTVLAIVLTEMVLMTMVGCSSTPGPRADKPVAPDANDPAFAIHDVKTWYLIGNAGPPVGDDHVSITVTAPAGTGTVDVWVGDLPPVRLAEAASASGTFSGEVAIADLAAGTYDVLLAADNSPVAFARLPIQRSAPYYVLVSTDWDFSDPGMPVSAYQDSMHRDHPGLRITHFVGPYTFTDPVVTAQRQADLVTWLVTQRDTFHDEIGLHIHPYCNFVTDAGLSCVTDQSTVYAADNSGYTIKLGAYDRTNMGTLLKHASDLFAQHGLNRPRTFRAGGWTATLDTLGALADNGFVADTSALNWARIEEWRGKELYRWTMEQWNPINDTSQPYWPGQDNIVAHSSPGFGLLEVPDNGVMIDYVSLAEMTGIFDANWEGRPIAAPITLMMGFHPAASFSDAEYHRVDDFLKYADLHLASGDLGPVVYITLSDVTTAFSPQ